VEVEGIVKLRGREDSCDESPNMIVLEIQCVNGKRNKLSVMK
jgi:hypothetical protein